MRQQAPVGYLDVAAQPHADATDVLRAWAATRLLVDAVAVDFLVGSTAARTLAPLLLTRHRRPSWNAFVALATTGTIHDAGDRRIALLACELAGVRAPGLTLPYLLGGLEERDLSLFLACAAAVARDRREPERI